MVNYVVRYLYDYVVRYLYDYVVRYLYDDPGGALFQNRAKFLDLRQKPVIRPH